MTYVESKGHVTDVSLKGQSRDLSTLRTRYLENG